VDGRPRIEAGARRPSPRGIVPVREGSSFAREGETTWLEGPASSALRGVLGRQEAARVRRGALLGGRRPTPRAVRASSRAPQSREPRSRSAPRAEITAAPADGPRSPRDKSGSSAAKSRSSPEEEPSRGPHASPRAVASDPSRRAVRPGRAARLPWYDEECWESS
jgi:hypothetical protein